MKKLFTMAIMLAGAVSLYAEDPAAESHWKTNGSASLQFTQGFVSKNWYKGGESNFALLGTADYNFNYTYENFTWDNRLEGKLGFVTTPSDTCHNYMTNSDYIKYTTKFGYKAAGDWYYTLQAIGQTQFCPGYKTNVKEEMSKFFSPAYLNVSLGMDYKKSTDKISWTVFLGPLAYNLKYVNDPYTRVSDGADGFVGAPGSDSHKINATTFGLKNAWDYNLYDFGVSAKAGMDWKVCKYLTWTSQATYFSPLYDCGKYKGNVYTTVEWENTFDMPLNEYFSTKLYTHLRFDDSVSPEAKFGGWGYFQFTELLSFGLSYKF
ncbi:MAG: DUF3078 domain-containing protein [Bacteroidales bacterium]|nr:DUF3078 domain-containing protein [Candidatus Liminaster caballi]